MFYKICKVIISIVFRLIFRIEITGNNKLPEGSYILCANHINVLDPFLLAMATNRQISFMAKKELFENKLIGFILKQAGVFSVDRKGLDMGSVKHAMAILENGNCLGIFPEGTRVKSVSEDNMKEGIGLIASRTKAMVQPVYIDGQYKFLGKLKVHFRQPIDSVNFSNLKSKERFREITKAVYHEIYQ